MNKLFNNKIIWNVPPGWIENRDKEILREIRKLKIKILCSKLVIK